LIDGNYGRTPDDIGRFTYRQILLFFGEVQAKERRHAQGVGALLAALR
jgi:hypothetical protein